MCQFKSGIILKNRVILAPEGNESHSDLLNSLNIEDTHMNAIKTFVRAELIPKNDNKATDIKDWKYVIDQDITPDWYDRDPGRYENKMRAAVAAYMGDRLKNVICGYDWTPVQDGNYTYYFMNGIMFESTFGKTNDYKFSYIREKLLASNLLTGLKEKFGDKLVPINLNLTSMDGFKDYGVLEEDLLSVLNVELLMRFGHEIPLVDKWYWLATPNQTPSRKDTRCVQYVGRGGNVNCNDCGCSESVRPFFILQS